MVPQWNPGILSLYSRVEDQQSASEGYYFRFKGAGPLFTNGKANDLRNIGPKYFFGGVSGNFGGVKRGCTVTY